MNRHVLFVLALSLLVSCTHTHVLDPSAERWSQVNVKSQTRRAAIALSDDREVVARSIQVTPDSTSWIDPESGALRSVATSKVIDVRFTYQGRGALQGAGYGFSIGGIVGAVGGYASGDDEPSIVSFQAEEKALILGGLGGIIGGLIGYGIGYNIKSKTVYHLEQEAVSAEP